ncbi:MAG: hypothetical protein J6B83_03050 [Bacteroidaceae bacterium]|nr:hypothetical protein [Bacteroidaceae bacterium]
MSEEVKTFNFDTGNNSLLAAILPSLQQRGVDTGMLMGMLSNNNRGGGGFFGNNGGFQDIIALIVIAAIFGNGNGNGIFGGGNNQNSTEREMLMSAIQRNGVDIGQLANTLNCSIGKVDAAIGQIATQICNLAGQQGLSFQQVINAIQAGNCAITNQIASCCCDLKQAIGQTNVALERGFSSVAYETQRQTCDIEKAIASSTNQILEGQRAAEMRDMQDKLDALREKNAQQAVILNNAQQTAQFQAMLAPIASDLAELKCNQVPVKKIACPEQYIPVNTGVNAQYGLIPTGCGYPYGYPFGVFGGNCGGSLWG